MISPFGTREPLALIIRDESKDVRRSAANGLGFSSDPDTVDIIGNGRQYLKGCKISHIHKTKEVMPMLCYDKGKENLQFC